MEFVAEVIKEFIEGAIKVSPREMAIQVASTLLLFLVVRLGLSENNRHNGSGYQYSWLSFSWLCC